MDQGSSSGIDESTLTKGQVRKLRALRKSVGEEIGEQAFAAWLSSQSGAGEDNADGNAATVVDTLWPLVEQGIPGDPARRLHYQTRAREDHRGAGAVVNRPMAFRRVRTPYCLLDIFSGADHSDSEYAGAGPWPGCRVLSRTQERVGAPVPTGVRPPQAAPLSVSSRRRIAPSLTCRPRSRHRRPKAARTPDTRPLRPRSRTYRGLRQWRARSP